MSDGSDERSEKERRDKLVKASVAVGVGSAALGLVPDREPRTAPNDRQPEDPGGDRELRPPLLSLCARLDNGPCPVPLGSHAIELSLAGSLLGLGSQFGHRRRDRARVRRTVLSFRTQATLA